MKITDIQKLDIGRVLQLEADAQGSWARLATRLQVNQVTLRYNMVDPEKWHLISDNMWAKVANKLGYKLNEIAWNLVPTTNTLVMMEILDRTQNEQLFTAVSHEAGQGKTAGVHMYRMNHDGVYYVECEESWSHKQFVRKVAETLGLRTENYTVSDMTDMVVARLKELAITTRPLLVIDEANKLKPASLRFFIPLFNKLQDEVGMVLIGAHDLKRHIEKGVSRDARGFDELASRLGRSFMELVGIFEKDVIAICEANGLEDPKVQKRIWERMVPTVKEINGKRQWVSKQDLRVLKAALKHERAAAQKRMETTELEEVMGGVAEMAMA